MRLLVVDDEELGKAIHREWLAQTEQELEVRDIAAAELKDAARLPGDVIVFPNGLMGQLVERGLIVPLNDDALADPKGNGDSKRSETRFDRRDIFDQVRLREMTWANRMLAVPLGSPQFLLVYRADVFERLALEPPKDWTAYQQAVERLADRAALGDLAPAEDQPWRATTEPLAEGWAGQLLLARSAAYAMHRDQLSPLFELDTFDPLIGQVPYERALGELAAAAKAGDFADQRFTPAQAMNEVIEGRAAMAIAWPAPQPAKGERTAKGKLGFALLPGSATAYNFATKKWEDRGAEGPTHVPLLSIAGRMVAVTSTATSSKRATGFLTWLAGKQVSSQVGPQSPGTTLFRQSQIPQASLWTGGLEAAASQQYAVTLEQSASLPQSLPGLRLPGRADYLAVLDAAVVEAVSGEASPQEALAKASNRWNEVSEALGVVSQKLANRRALGQASLP
jgi:ABC-type glycerol-3-phosphate transport system substrate-binding protein